MPLYCTLEAAREARRAGVFWTIRVEYTGHDPRGEGQHPDKFWTASAEGYGSCKIHWAKSGSKGHWATKPFVYVEEKVSSMLADGYVYTPGTRAALW